MNENSYQAKVINTVRNLIPGCIVLKNDSSYFPGIPDLLILYKDMWAMLEVKSFRRARHRPNQDFYVRLLDEMSFAALIYPEVEEAVLHDLQQSFGLIGQTRVSQPQ